MAESVALLEHAVAVSGPINTDPVHSESHKITKLVYVAAAISGATALSLGFDVGVMADAEAYIQVDFKLSDGLMELIIGSLNFISAFGALMGGPTADKYGRKPTVVLCCGFYLVGTLLMTCAPSWEFLLCGRIITGLGVGVSLVIVPVYVSEISPKEVRGKLVTIFDVSINAGILLGYIVGLVLEFLVYSDTVRWRLALGLGLVSPLIVLISLGGLPESPRCGYCNFSNF